MKILKIILIVVISLVLIGGAGYMYASSGVKSKPGYAELVTPTGESVDALFSINIGPRGIKPARWLFEQAAKASDHKSEMPERVLNSVLQGLQGVQLRVYEVDDNQPVFDNAVAESVLTLKEQSWETLMTVREDEEHIAVMKIGEGEEITGLSIMVSTPENAVFVNLIGPFDPEAIAAAASQIN